MQLPSEWLASTVWFAVGHWCTTKYVSLYSTPEQLAALRQILFAWMRLPFSHGLVPGRVLEEALAHVRAGEVLPTYDFVDVVSPAEARGWQVKSTREATPVTWKRAKLADADQLIDASLESDAACQELGDAIIRLCNEHAQQSLADYALQEIGYARLVLHDGGRMTYFERSLCSVSKPNIFNARDFSWRWSSPKATVKKEQLPALHGTHRRTDEKWWAWHGRGENQLHFSGESSWWPRNNRHAMSFQMPLAGDKLTIDDLLAALGEPESDA